MVRCVDVRVRSGAEQLAGPGPRYALLRRLRECAARQGVVVLAFGIGKRSIRLVFRGSAEDVADAVRGLKVGTTAAHRATGGVFFAENEYAAFDDVEAAVVWAHSAPLRAGASGPLATPWSSHRDLLGYRVADFFDAGPLRRAVDGRRVHTTLGGGPLPDRGLISEGESTQILLRVAGAVRGLLPSDRRCFRLFAHLARAAGRSTLDVAAALRLGERRVRQMFAEPEPLLRPALLCLGDGRLRVVP